ncbi:hypothetical protein [Priestia megaterium]|uniref:hypothetical protein n=1 Tax=Priestia megaterium TaxID=1404 RepID=UPI002363FF0A|nr:hypothetical protein [Priestia megaterium]MDD1515357.1 hypothetical protein [Priestia megaterium]
MKRKRFLTWILILLLLAVGAFWYYNSIAIWGTSDNGMWKATYKKNFDQTEGGWNGTIKQKSGNKVKVEKITFTDNKKTLMSTGNFVEEEMEDGSVTKLYPFSTEFYGLGDAPKKGHIYKVHVTWVNKGKEQTDTFRLK